MAWPQLGIGLGWRPEVALFINRWKEAGFVEILAEDFTNASKLPPALHQLRARQIPIIPHGVSMGLGSGQLPDTRRIEHLAQLASTLQSPYVSEHLAFVRGEGLESGHLLPLPHHEAMLEVVIENVRYVQARLPVPLVIENIASLFEWPDATMDEADFLNRLVNATGVGLLLDLENIYANCRNRGGEPMALISRLPLDAVAYMHVAGGIERNGWFHDTHTYPTSEAVIDLVEQTLTLHPIPGVMLERDGNFPPYEELARELAAIKHAYMRGNQRWSEQVKVLG